MIGVDAEDAINYARYRLSLKNGCGNRLSALPVENRLLAAARSGHDPVPEHQPLIGSERVAYLRESPCVVIFFC